MRPLRAQRMSGEPKVADLTPEVNEPHGGDSRAQERRVEQNWRQLCVKLVWDGFCKARERGGVQWSVQLKGFCFLR